jgi:Leucine-rich repeat (LRR) protein
MKYFGIISLLITVTIGVILTVGSLSGGQYEDKNGNTQNTSYQAAIDSAQSVADGSAQAGALRIEIYYGIPFSRNATVVDLSGRALTGSLKAEIRTLSNLEVLDVSNNQLTGLPAEIGQLSQLKTLNISNNPLTGLPREIGQLQNLELLDLSGTQYSTQDLAAIQAQLPSTTVVIIQ